MSALDVGSPGSPAVAVEGASALRPEASPLERGAGPTRSTLATAAWLTLPRLALAVLVSRVAVAVYPAIPHVRTDLVSTLNRWDAAWYLLIAARGYANPLAPGFFPLYPLLERSLSPLLGLPNAAVAITWIGLPLAAWGILELAGRFSSRRAAVVATAVFVWNPVSTFLVAGYPETLFVAFTAWALVSCLDRRWLRAASLAALASATFPQGALLGVVVALAIIVAEPTARGAAKAVGCGLIGELGLIGFMSYCWVRLGNPLAMRSVQSHGWHVEVRYPLHVIVADVESLLGVGGWARGDEALHGMPRMTMLSVDALAGLVGVAATLIVLRWVRRDTRWLPLAVVLAVNVLVSVSVSDPWGDSTARFIFDVAPLYVVGAAAIDRCSRRGFALAAGAIVSFCALIAIFTEGLFNLYYWVT